MTVLPIELPYPCSGACGVKIMYDSFFKEVMNAESNPEPLEGFLTTILGRKVHILHVLPNDTTRITDEASLLVTDIIVQLEDGSVANIEVQRIGYMFPAQRCSCYSADMLLRQYKRIRSEKKRDFTYRDVKTTLSSYMNAAHMNYPADRNVIYTTAGHLSTQESVLICYRILFSYHLTIFISTCTINL